MPLEIGGLRPNYYGGRGYSKMSRTLSLGLFAEKAMKGEFSYYKDCERLPDGTLTHPGVTTRNIMELKEKLVPRPTDIFITSYVRSGTNWVSYIIHLIVSGGVPLDKDLDIITPCIDPMALAEVEVRATCMKSAILCSIVIIVTTSHPTIG